MADAQHLRDSVAYALGAKPPDADLQGAVAAALASGPQQPNPSPENPTSGVSRTESVVRGAAQGATLGFADEITAAAKALGTAPMKLLAALGAGPGGIGSYVNSQLGFTDDYRAERDTERAKYDAAQQENPGSYLAGQVAGGLASAIVPGGAPSTLAKAVAVGAGYGAASGLGASKADLTKGEIKDAAVDTAIGASAGGVAGAAGYGAAKAGGAVRNWLLPKQSIASRAAADATADAIPSSTQNVSEYTKASRALEEEVGKATGKRMQFSPGQATGSKEVLAAERTAAQTPGAIDKMAKAQRERLGIAGDYLDTIIKHVAADHQQLGSGEVGDRVAGAITKNVASRVRARSEATRPLYERADKLLGDKKIAPIDEVAAFISSELDRAVGPFQASAAPLKHTLETLQKHSKNGFANVKVVRALAEKWGQQAEGTGNLLADLPISQRKYIASRLSETLNRAIDSAAESGQASDKGVQALREAQRVWAEHSQGIDNIATDAVKKILGVAEVDKADTIPKLVMSMSPNQIRGVIGILDRTDAVASRQLKAGILLDAFRGAGAMAREGAFGDEIAATLSPTKLITAINSNGSKLRALLGDDKIAINKLNAAVEMARRLGSGPSIEGSDTFAKTAQFFSGMIKSAKATGLTDMAVGAIKEVARQGVFSEEKAAELFATREGIEAFHELMQAQIKGQAEGKGRAAAVRGAALAAAKLARLAGNAANEPAAVKSDDSGPQIGMVQ